MKLKECENFVVLGIFLGVVGLVSALVLGLVSNSTDPAIKEAKKRTKSAAMKQLKLPEFNNDPTQETCKFDGVTFMALRDDKKLVGIVAEAETNGYADKVRELVGFLPDGTITAVLVMEEKETPGLGKNVCERKFQKDVTNFTKPAPEGLPPNPILDQFSGKKAGDKIDWRVKKDGGDFEFRTGATVTSRAVTEMTGKAAKTFAKHRAEIMKAFPEVAK